MGLSVHQGTGTLPTTSEGTVAITDPGFTPDAIILWCGETTADGSNAGLAFAFGYSDGTTDAFNSAQADDNVATSNTSNGGGLGNCLGMQSADGAGWDWLISVQSFDANGFTLVADATDYPGTAYQFSYIAIGGLAEAKVLHLDDINDSDPISFAHAMGGTPDCGILLYHQTTQDQSAIGSAQIMNSIGVFKSDGTSAGLGFGSRDAQATTDAFSDLRTAAIAGSSFRSDQSPDWIATVSTDATNVTLDYTDTPIGNWDAIVLLLRGCEVAVGSFTQATGSPYQNSLTPSLDPKVFLAFTHGRTTADEQLNLIAGLGGATSISAEHCLSITDEDNVGTTDANRDWDTASILKIFDKNAALQSEGDITTFESESIVITWDDGAGGAPAANAYHVGYLILGDAVAGGPTTYYITPSGSIAPTGGLVNQTQKGLAGSVGSTGALLQQAQKILTGAIAPTGALTRQTEKPLTGSIAPTGDWIASIAKALTGSLPSSGALTQQSQKSMAGAITPTGDPAHETQKSMDGSIASSGALNTTKVALVSMAGTLPSAGALVKQTQKALAGALSSSGSLAKSVSAVYEGTLAPTGSLVKQIAKSIGGALTPSGALAVSKVVLQSMAGSLTPAGALLNQVNKTLAGTLGSSGAIVMQVGKSLAGTLAPSGTLIKSVIKSFAGTIVSVGTAVLTSLGVIGRDQIEFTLYIDQQRDMTLYVNRQKDFDLER